jgi:hypothetical protein
VDFTHSWNEVEGDVFDVAIRHMLNDDQYPPVFAGIDVSNGVAAPFEYGIVRELDLVGLDVQRTPFSALMDQVPYYENGGWSIVERVAAKL